MNIDKYIERDDPHYNTAERLAARTQEMTNMLIVSLAKAAADNGIEYEKAVQIAAQAVFGSAKLVSESSEHPYALVDKVCSPGGTTIEGLLSLLRDGFEGQIIDAIENTENCE